MLRRGCLATLLTLLMIASALHPAWSEEVLSLRCISSRPEVVSGDDTLVKLNAPRDLRWTANLGGRDVTRLFRQVDNSGEFLALLNGLKNGDNLLEIRVGGTTKATLELLNHPIGGPVFSGPRQGPFICQTLINGLGPALDNDCNAKTVVEYYYKSTQPSIQDWTKSTTRTIQMMGGKIPFGLPSGFKPYPRNRPPNDVAETVTSDGRTVPYVVRREIGVINRAVYDIRFLHQPGSPLPTPWSNDGSGWNRRLVYLFGGGSCGSHRQGNLYIWASNEALLARGYAVATATLNTTQNNCNPIISAETLSMVKEHFAKTYGAPLHTIGLGSSGGAMQLYFIAQNYPGLLDGIVPYISFPDMVSLIPWTSDCSLFVRAFGQIKPPLTDIEKSAITGFADWDTCKGWDRFALLPQRCDSQVPPSAIYAPLTHPKGIRCDFYDTQTGVFEKDSKTGFAVRALDNVGVQYGLVAFSTGEISAEQFVELNEKMGGFDVDDNIVSERTHADVDAVRAAYDKGLVTTGGGGLRETPIIDWRWYSDDLGDNHDSIRSFITRARLIAASGTAANQIIAIGPRRDSFATTLSSYEDPDPNTSLVARRGRDLVEHMDRWLDNIAADSSSHAMAEKVTHGKPSDLTDACLATDGGEIAGASVYDKGGECTRLFPQYSDPRIAAGAPITDDVLKCQLKPISQADYARPLTADQLNRLQAVFPAGVCDYNLPGIGQKITKSVWQKY